MSAMEEMDDIEGEEIAELMRYEPLDETRVVVMPSNKTLEKIVFETHTYNLSSTRYCKATKDYNCIFYCVRNKIKGALKC